LEEHPKEAVQALKYLQYLQTGQKTMHKTPLTEGSIDAENTAINTALGKN
jgi:hypothetical protein